MPHRRRVVQSVLRTACLLSLVAGLFLAPVAGLSHLLLAWLCEVRLEIAAGIAGDENHLGAVAVGAVGCELVRGYSLIPGSSLDYSVGDEAELAL